MCRELAYSSLETAARRRLSPRRFGLFRLFGSLTRSILFRLFCRLALRVLVARTLVGGFRLRLLDEVVEDLQVAAERLVERLFAFRPQALGRLAELLAHAHRVLADIG